MSVTLAVGMVLGLLYAFTLVTGPDQMQLLEKAIRLSVYGKWTHWGNVVTGGGSNPGSLSTALVGLPLILWDSPWAFDLLISLLHLSGLFLLYWALDEEFSDRERLAFFALVWLTPWRTSNTFLWNPSYLFFPAALHFYSAQRSSHGPRFWMSFWHVLAIGFAMQVHQSFLILIVTSCYLWVRKQVRVHWWGLAAGVLVLLASMIPFFLAMRENSHLAPIVSSPDSQFYYGRGLIEVYPLLKGLFYWPRFTSGIFPADIFSAVTFDWVQSPRLRSLAELGFAVLKYTAGVLTLLLSVGSLIWFFKKVFEARPQMFLLPGFVDNFVLGSFLAVFVSSSISPIVFSNWHLMLVMPITYIQFTKFLFQGIDTFTLPRRWNWGHGFLVLPLCVYFVIYGALGVFVSKAHSFRENMHTEFSQIKDNCMLKSRLLDRGN